MSDEGRKIFAMETALGVLANEGGSDVLDLLSFVISRNVTECCRPAVAPMVKGWLYSLNPDLMLQPFDGSVSYDSWVNDQKSRLGDSVSVPVMAQAEVAGIHGLIDTVEKALQTAQEKATEAKEVASAKAEVEKELKAATPFKAKSEDLEKKVAQLEEKVQALTAEVAAEKAKSAEFDGKLAINENEIEKTVKDIISKAVSSMSLTAGAAVAAGEEGGEAAAAPADFGDAGSDSSGDVPDSFGFGASGSDGDGFGF